jgi:hypothetical protein
MSLDASRRLVIAQDRNFKAEDGTTSEYFTCPEPPPDAALSTLSESIIGLNARTGDSAELANSYRAIALALSARTSTVEVWRTTTSAYCVLLMNGKPAEADALLTASLFALQRTNDMSVINPTQVDLISTLSKDVEAQRARIKEISDQNRANYLRTNLELAKLKCDRVPEAQRATHGDCIRKNELTVLVSQLPTAAQTDASPPAGQQAPKEASS